MTRAAENRSRPRKTGAARLAPPLAVGMLALAGGAYVAGAPQTQAVTRSVLVTATDDVGRPVEGLTPSDLVVREGGKTYAVESVSPSVGPMRVALAIDELLAPNTIIRRALVTLAQRLSDRAEVALYVLGRTNELRVPYGASVAAVANAVSALPSRGQYPGPLVEAVMEIARAQRSFEGRRALVLFAPEIPRASRVKAEGALDAIRDGRVTFYAATYVGWTTRPSGIVEMPPTRLEGQDLTEDVEGDRLIDEGTTRSGGMRLPSTTPDGFLKAVERISSDLDHQLVVVYTVPAGTKSDGRLNVEPRRRGLKVRAPSRLPAF